MKVDACGASHRGNIRKHNEDNIYVDGVFRNDLSMDNVLIRSKRSSSPYMYAVFDGLGGEACGEQASLIAALGLKAMEDRCVAEDIETYISAAHKAIIKESMHRGVRNMGTTVAALMVCDNRATVFNVGDSRVYLFRNGRLTQLSKDHSVVQSLIDNGLLNEEDRSPGRYDGELTQYVGMISEDDVEPSAYKKTITIKPGDLFLLCSDGLTGEISEGHLCDLLDNNEDNSEMKAVNLINKAIFGECRDNVSVIVCALK